MNNTRLKFRKGRGNTLVSNLNGKIVLLDRNINANENVVYECRLVPMKSNKSYICLNVGVPQDYIKINSHNNGVSISVNGESQKELSFVLGESCAEYCLRAVKRSLFNFSERQIDLLGREYARLEKDFLKRLKKACKS